MCTFRNMITVFNKSVCLSESKTQQIQNIQSTHMFNNSVQDSTYITVNFFAREVCLE
uniref:Uncharacterized protein n=1 Tax=Arion vulgaris TaxID=1028688 RepID=A0A0B7B8B5_9EUPU